MPNGDRTIVVEFTDDVQVPYVDQAETMLDPFVRPLWDALAAQFPFLTLNRLYYDLEPEAIWDILDAIRSQGEEPPNLLATFKTLCPPELVDEVVTALAALPFVEYAEVQSDVVPATVHYGDDRESEWAPYLNRAPIGMSVLHAWSVAGGDGAGVICADVEYGWMLDHEDLSDALIARGPVYPGVVPWVAGRPPADQINHGTGALGIVLASDNEVGTVGIAPSAYGLVVPVDRGFGADLAHAIFVASHMAGRGGVLLIELGKGGWYQGKFEAARPVESDVHIAKAILAATQIGVTVIEPAGNANVNLDAPTENHRLQPGHPSFFESGAVIVGGSDPNTRQRHPDSTFGSRVNCFAPFEGYRAPSSKTPPPGRGYQDYNGTSGAGAIIAGAACALQGMALAHTNDYLPPSEIRRLLSDFGLNTRSGNSSFANPNADSIGVMPDLRAIAQSKLWPRYVPVAAVRMDHETVHLVGVDEENQLFRQFWQDSIGDWSTRVSVTGGTRIPPVRVGLVCFEEDYLDAFAVSSNGVLLHTWWHIQGNARGLWDQVSDQPVLSASEAVAAAADGSGQIVVAAIGDDARLRAARGLHLTMHDEPQAFVFHILDTSVSFSGSAGPAVVENAVSGVVEVLAVDRDGQLRWATIPPGGVPVTVQQAVLAIGGTLTRLAPSSGIAVTSRSLAFGPLVFDAFAIGSDWLLYHTRSPGFGLHDWNDLQQIGGPRELSTDGNVAAVARHPDSLDVFAIDREGYLVWTWWEGALGPAWADLEVVDDLTRVNPLGGVSAVSRTEDTMEVFAHDFEGRLYCARWQALDGWTPLIPV